MLTYLGNTLIFMIVGVVISQRSLEYMSISDGFFIIVLYFGLNTIRLVLIVGLSPLLSRLGYGFNWRWAAVCIWSGTKGAFTLSLALMAYQLEGLDEVNVRNKILLHVSGTVVHVDDLLQNTRTARCPDCEKNIPWEPSLREIDDMMEEARIRVLKAQKTSYWRQYSAGMLNRQAARTLISITENMIDSGRISKFCYRMVFTNAFEFFVYMAILLNVFPLILEYIPNVNVELEIELRTINYIFFVVYVVQALMKALAVRKAYIFDHWNQFDVFIITLAAADIIIDQLFERSVHKIRTVRIFRLVRLARVLRLLKIMIPTFIHLLNKQINKQLSFGYDIGKGYVVGEEDVSNLIDHISDQKVISEVMQYGKTKM
ncbi:hypothetical protein chiPu_0009393 [Chiloscyllium punctatum]|uniref:Ion transport domain-containing protein n=1 Tax=Chiloscyllium punctatum TaxID=137246 RepID=A0A401SKM6_CHIPU|nr:hypothetical protein [Chiloscyllium punctatum]